MKKTFLILIAFCGLFAGCSKDVVLKNAKSGYVEVTLNKDLLERNRELQQLLYSFNKDYATVTVDKLGEWEAFVDKYGYSFSSNEAIAEYNTLCDYEEQYIKKFTAEERAQIKKLVNQ